MKMIPGMSQMPGLDKVKVDPKDVARKRAMVLSMTPAERHLEAELSPSPSSSDCRRFWKFIY